MEIRARPLWSYFYAKIRIKGVKKWKNYLIYLAY